MNAAGFLNILQSLQNPSEINGDDLSKIRYEASRHFMNKKLNI
jgi:hypothetical protein